MAGPVLRQARLVFSTLRDARPSQFPAGLGLHRRGCHSRAGTSSVAITAPGRALRPRGHDRCRHLCSAWRNSRASRDLCAGILRPGVDRHGLQRRLIRRAFSQVPGKRGRSGLCPRRLPVRLARPCRWISRDPFWSRLVGSNNGREHRIFTGVR